MKKPETTILHLQIRLAAAGNKSLEELPAKTRIIRVALIAVLEPGIGCQRQDAAANRVTQNISGSFSNQFSPRLSHVSI